MSAAGSPRPVPPVTKRPWKVRFVRIRSPRRPVTGRLTLAELIVVAVVMGLDNFAAAVVLGTLGQAVRRWRIAAVFAAFGAAAPMLGVAAGRGIAGALEVWAEWLGVAVLAGLGAWALWNAWHGGGAVGEHRARGAATGTGLLVLAATLSTDNLAIGFGLGLHDARVLPVGIAAGAAVFVATLAGLEVGRAGRRRWGRYATAAAGVMLIGIALALARGWI
jgi:putative Mn2+ efflux pump MntP